MSLQKQYSEKDLEEFKGIILKKLDEKNYEIENKRRKLLEISEQLGKIKLQGIEDSPDIEEREMLNYEIWRLEGLVKKLEDALQRIHQKTYGICVGTGELIPKERLRLVPHTTHSVTAKKNRI